MFGGRVDFLKGRVIVKIAVIKFIDNGVDMGFEGLEIDPHAQFVQLSGPYGNPDLPVVSMGLFAISWVVAKMVTTGKVGFYKNINHYSFLG